MLSASNNILQIDQLLTGISIESTKTNRTYVSQSASQRQSSRIDPSENTKDLSEVLSLSSDRRRSFCRTMYAHKASSGFHCMMIFGLVHRHRSANRLFWINAYSPRLKSVSFEKVRLYVQSSSTLPVGKKNSSTSQAAKCCQAHI
jgi:hypothetical protein